ncbi:MAG: hypothetical protein ACREQT_09325 [Candidatus Binataceae bacterium]
MTEVKADESSSRFKYREDSSRLCRLRPCPGVFRVRANSNDHRGATVTKAKSALLQQLQVAKQISKSEKESIG